jgi:hypothetical protein
LSEMMMTVALAQDEEPQKMPVDDCEGLL